MTEKGDYPLHCCIEAPESYRRKAKYTLETLLYPLCIRPVWVQKAALGEAPALYYGPRPNEVELDGVKLPLYPSTVAFFEKKEDPFPGEPVPVMWDGEPWPVFFGNTSDNCDLIASGFYWLSGWQERYIRQRDQHGRFTYASSLQSRLGTVERPLVDAYREMLAEALVDAGIPVRRRTWGGKKWAFCPTHDIDYLRKWRPGMIYRETVEYGLFDYRQKRMGQRLHRLGSFLGDVLRPGDVFRQAFDRIWAEVKDAGGTATYFLKMGAHGPRDVHYRPNQLFLKRRYASMAEEGVQWALHPSYHAYDHPGYLKQEKDRLEDLIGHTISTVRQHYLRYDVHRSPGLLNEAGFLIDSTLGFSGHEGFRNGTCHPFRLYDLNLNQATGLWEFPLSLMEATLFNKRQLTLDKAVSNTKNLLAMCARFRGVCVALWHNTLWDEMDYPGWGDHFVVTLDMVRRARAPILSLEEAYRTYVGGAGP